MSEMYHSHHAVIRTKQTGKRIVRIVDRYYPGPPGPEYSAILDLDPADAFALGQELIREAQRVLEIDREEDEAGIIRKRIVEIASAAKAEACA